MTKELIALLDGKETGRIIRDGRGKLTFTYSEQWREAAGAYPLSLSMPLTLAEHPNARMDPFLWGLLPDNEIILGNWARKFHVSARNALQPDRVRGRGLRRSRAVCPASKAQRHSGRGRSSH
jgi:serine/threonine-protein kinase HipA